jgi:hypothetical protein
VQAAETLFRNFLGMDVRAKEVWLRHLGLALWCAPLSIACVATAVFDALRLNWWWVAVMLGCALWNARLVWKNLDAIRRWG